MRLLHACALFATLALSTPALAQVAGEPAPVPHSFSRAIPPESVARMMVSRSRGLAVSAAVVTPRTVMPRPVRAIVLPSDVAPAAMPAVVVPSLSRAVAVSPDVPERAAPVIGLDGMSDDEALSPRVPVRAAVRGAGGGVDAATRCVAMAVYHEARGESLRGQRAVADVVLNRARSGRWGSGACSVVDAPHQFTNRWSWSPPVQGVASWDRALAIAQDAVSGMVGVSSRLMNFRAASMGAGGRSFMRIGRHAFW